MAVSHCLSSGFPVAQVEAHPEGEAEVQVMGIVDHRRQSLTVCFVDSCGSGGNKSKRRG